MASQDIEKYKFKKGHQKLGGRKKGTKNASTVISTLLKKTVSQEYEKELDEKFKKLNWKIKSVSELFYAKMILSGMDGNTKAMELVCYYHSGKPTEFIETDNRLTIEFVDKTDEQSA